MMPSMELAYLGIEVPDPGDLTPFFADVIGLTPGCQTSETMTWRNDHKVHRLIVQPGSSNDAVFFGLEVPDEAALESMASKCSELGVRFSEASPDRLLDRKVSHCLELATPWGVRAEVVVGLEDAASPCSSPLVPGGFKTEGVGFGHVVFATTAFDESCEFVTSVLGFRQTDWLETELAEGIPLEVRFFHCNPRHHSLALARAPFELPQQLHHVMFETNERDDVGSAFDRAWDAGLAIPNGLGRHDNDEMFSFYVASPAGFLVEVGFGARVVSEPWQDDRLYEHISAWGHQPLRQA